ncbi:hypothetical protein [Kribbella sp. VKM Ac-2500]|uniref:hypothetical protein n=1 Tax=Kribbella sp. VKM Ac-2500 TaxID=2512214 RepID=UPI00351A7342
MQLLGFTDADGTNHQTRRWEPKRLRLRLFSTAAKLARTGRRTTVHLARNGTWTTLLHARAHPAPCPHRTRLTHLPPVPRPETNPASGTGVHPRRHPGPCPTRPQESAPNAGRQTVATANARVTKDPG